MHFRPLTQPMVDSPMIIKTMLAALEESFDVLFNRGWFKITDFEVIVDGNPPTKDSTEITLMINGDVATNPDARTPVDRFSSTCTIVNTGNGWGPKSVALAIDEVTETFTYQEMSTAGGYVVFDMVRTRPLAPSADVHVGSLT